MLEAAFVVVHALESSQERMQLFHSVLSAWKQTIRASSWNSPGTVSVKLLASFSFLRLLAGVCYQSKFGACFLLWIMDSSCK